MRGDHIAVGAESRAAVYLDGDNVFFRTLADPQDALSWCPSGNLDTTGARQRDAYDIALVGGEDMVAASEYGYLELLLTRARPDYQLRFRNLMQVFWLRRASAILELIDFVELIACIPAEALRSYRMQCGIFTSGALWEMKVYLSAWGTWH